MNPKDRWTETIHRSTSGPSWTGTAASTRSTRSVEPRQQEAQQALGREELLREEARLAARPELPSDGGVAKDLGDHEPFGGGGTSSLHSGAATSATESGTLNCGGPNDVVTEMAKASVETEGKRKPKFKK